MVTFVVVNECILGCVDDRQPNNVQVLHSSILRGGPMFCDNHSMCVTGRGVRLATRQDFDDYRVCYSDKSPEDYRPLAEIGKTEWDNTRNAAYINWIRDNPDTPYYPTGYLATVP